MGIRVLLIIVGLLMLVAGCAEEPYRASKIRYQHPTWDTSIVNKVARRQVEPGMTSDMVRLAVGLPDSITRDGEKETWGYAVFENDYQPVKKYVYFVYFEQGVVTKTSGNKDLLKTFKWYD